MHVGFRYVTGFGLIRGITVSRRLFVTLDQCFNIERSLSPGHCTVKIVIKYKLLPMKEIEIPIRLLLVRQVTRWRHSSIEGLAGTLDFVTEWATEHNSVCIDRLSLWIFWNDYLSYCFIFGEFGFTNFNHPLHLTSWTILRHHAGRWDIQTYKAHNIIRWPWSRRCKSNLLHKSAYRKSFIFQERQIGSYSPLKVNEIIWAGS